MSLPVYDPPVFPGEPTPPLTPLLLAAFAALTLALAALWWPPTSKATRWPAPWMVFGGLAVGFALPAGLVDGRGVVALLIFALACLTDRATSRPAVRVAAQLVTLIVGAALFLHLLPGFDNPRVIANAVAGPGALPYSKYLNFDKGAAALLLLGLYVPDRTARDEGARHAGGIAWRVVVVSLVVLLLSLALAYVRWDPKLPPWWPAWLWSMVFLTALPEEAVFRGLLQEGLRRTIQNGALIPRGRVTLVAVVTAGAAFGMAHVAGGAPYVFLATVAGIGYGWVYASCRSFAGAVIAHSALNTLHLLLFTYPALASAVIR